MRINPVTGELLLGPGKAWFDTTRSATQVGSDAAGWKTVTSHGEVLDEQGFNFLAAGGGKWATWLAGRGPKGNFGDLDPAGIVTDIGWDGTVAWRANYQAGGPNGILGQPLENNVPLWTRVVGPNHVAYALANGTIWSSQLGTARIPAGITPFSVHILGDALLYHTHEHLVLQQYGSPRGIVVAPKPAYSPDMVRVAGGYRVVYCLNEGETQTAERVVLDSELVNDLTSLRDFAAPPPPPPPPPVKPVEPKPVSDVLATLKTVRAKFGLNNTPEQLGALLNEVAWIHRSEGVGLERKDSGDIAIQPTTGIHIGHDILRFPGNVGRDVLNDAEGVGEPTWGDAGPADPARFVTPVEPSGVIVTPPGPTPIPALTGGSFASAAGAFETKFAALTLVVAALKAEVVELRALKTAPAPALEPGIDGKRIALRTDNGHYVGVYNGGGAGVYADRDAVGDWETFTVEIK